MLKFDLSMCYSVDNIPVKAVVCRREGVCKKHFNISYVKVEPYSAEIVADLLSTCCGRCHNSSIVNTFENISQINPSSINTSHFVFPVLGRSAAIRLYGYSFIPLIEPPSLYYFTKKDSKVMIQLLKACLDMWPLLTISLLMVIISGFIGWFMETWFNKDEFPRPFLIGWFEGFWWSFISMTTVGYGDKIPRSIPARLFSIIWILIGITTFSIITAMLSAEITKANSPDPPKLAGARVGALRHRTYDAALIAGHGGILVDVEPINKTYGVTKLIHMLQGKEIDGFVLDRYSFVLFYHYLSNLTGHEDDISFIKKETIRTEKTYMGDRLAYGILVRNMDDYQYLADFVKDNREVFNTCNLLYINNMSGSVKFKTIKNALFATSGGFFWPSFIIVTTIIGVICCFGAIYELYRRKFAAHEVTHSYSIAIKL